MKLDPQQVLNGFLIGLGAGFGWPLADFLMHKLGWA